MGIEVIGVLIFASLIEFSELLKNNAGLVFFSSLLLILWITGIITVVRRWRAE